MKIVETIEWIVLVSLLLVGRAVKAQHLPQWLEEAVVYQVYPASFKDSDNDGIGDLKGIESQLDYIKSIGVNTIWISPVFSSEFFDGGYNVTDFYSVDKHYGTNPQLVSLVRRVRKGGMKIFMGLVAGHTPDKHPWLLRPKQADRNLQHSDCFIWTPARAERPKQFAATDCEHSGNYMRNFFGCQPAPDYGYVNPNPEHPWEQSVDAPGPQAVRRELKNIISFWIDKGTNGFWVDMTYSLMENDPKHIETSRLWKDTSTWLEEKYPEGAFIAEWGELTNSIGGEFHIDFLFHIGRREYTSLFFNRKRAGDINCYFELEGARQVRQFVEVYQKEYGGTRGKDYISLPTSNRDIWRLTYGKHTNLKQLKVAMTFLLTIPGVPCVYCGDEAEMKYIEGLPDVGGSVLTSRNRAESRTPMQWDGSADLGFSTTPAGKLYIPVDPAEGAPTVEQQQAGESSLLNYICGVLKLRDSSKALGNTGDWRMINNVEQPYPLIYLHEADGERYCVAVNPSAKKVTAKFPTFNSGKWEIVLGDREQTKCKGGTTEGCIKMAPVSAVIFKISE